MSVTFRIELCCECDKCLDQLILDQVDIKGKTTKYRLLSRAYNLGWHIVGNNCLCPKCTPTNSGSSDEQI